MEGRWSKIPSGGCVVSVLLTRLCVQVYILYYNTFMPSFVIDQTIGQLMDTRALIKFLSVTPPPATYSSWIAVKAGEDASGVPESKTVPKPLFSLFTAGFLAQPRTV